MPLYSTDIHSKAGGQRSDAGDVIKSAEESVSPGGECTSWCYLFVHHSKVEQTDRLLSEKFKTFIHRTTVYKKDDKKIRKEERPTISGLVFVQGDKVEIQDFLNRNCHRVYLARDCTTKDTAVIPDKIMRSFMQFDLGRNRVRLMPHPLTYYSEGHSLIRVTSGLLAGFEGYIVRISRNRCLVTSLGGLTVSISGISKETFENA